MNLKQKWSYMLTDHLGNAYNAYISNFQQDIRVWRLECEAANMVGTISYVIGTLREIKQGSYPYWQKIACWF